MNYKPILFFISLIFVACTGSHIVDIELPEEVPRLTAIYELKKLHSSSNTIFVSHSKPILDTTAYEIIDDAEIKLYKDDDFITEFIWFDPSNGYLAFAFSTVVDSGKYEMVISAPGFETIRAQQSLPSNPEIHRATYIKDGTTDVFGNVKDLLEIEIKDEEMEENYYSIAISAKGKDSSGVAYANVFGYTDDLNKAFGWREEFIPDEIFNGETYVFRYLINVDLDEIFDINNGGKIDEFNINIFSYSKAYFDYSTSVVKYRNNQNLPFTEPVIIPSNWENGYGVFSAVNLKKFLLEL